MEGQIIIGFSCFLTRDIENIIKLTLNLIQFKTRDSLEFRQQTNLL